jgi:reactive intermediate/imine deaminase
MAGDRRVSLLCTMYAGDVMSAEPGCAPASDRPGHEEADVAFQVIRPAGVHPTSGYSHAVRTGNTLYVSGQVPRDPENRIVDGDVEAQVRQVFANLHAVLEAAGASFRDVVKITTFLTDREHFETWRRVRAEFVTEPYPASTLVVVEALSYPEYVVEIEVIAALGDA